MTNNNWFNVDKTGLSKLMTRRGGPAFILYELTQNAWDQRVTRVTISFSPIDGKPAVHLAVVDDDPEGFKDLAHAFTFFAESEKKADPTKRGRFNMGEKLVLACCEWASITTTTGTVEFGRDGTRRRSNRKTEKGSRFEAEVRMTRAEYVEACEAVKKLIPPPGIETLFNGKPLRARQPVVVFEESLPTEISDEEGCLRRTTRKTEVRVYETFPGEKAMIYEMGIPVVETGDKYHIDIQQKVPLNMDRDNVPPSYLQTVRTAVLNRTASLLTEEDATEGWVRAGTGDERCAPEAVKQVLDLRYGPHRVAYDPSDPEANKLAVSKGYTVVKGGSLSGGEWENAKKAGAILPAGQVTPSRPPATEAMVLVHPDAWTSGMRGVVALAQVIARRVLGISNLSVCINNNPGTYERATYGPGGPLTLNFGNLGPGFFERFPANLGAVVDLLIHEFGHQYCSDHLDDQYYRALTSIGGKVVELALREPALFSADRIAAPQPALAASGAFANCLSDGGKPHEEHQRS